VWRARSAPGPKFLIAWVVPSWIVLEAAMTKLPHYVLPLYPAIAILVAAAIERRALTQNRWLRRGPVWWFVITVLVALAAIAINIVVGQQPGIAAWPFAVGAVIFSLFAWWLYDVDGVEASFLRAIAAAILLYAALFGVTIPTVRALFPSRQIAKIVADPRCARPAFVSAGYFEPSLVFLIGTGLYHGTGGSAADFLAAGDCRFAFVEKNQERAFVTRADAIGLRYRLAPRVEGFNISSGRAVSIGIYVGAGR
jgi:4-amino-4-deoxy-L-arabinose transferase-like glycosyltransferase